MVTFKDGVLPLEQENSGPEGSFEAKVIELNAAVFGGRYNEETRGPVLVHI